MCPGHEYGSRASVFRPQLPADEAEDGHDRGPREYAAILEGQVVTEYFGKNFLIRWLVCNKYVKLYCFLTVLQLLW